MTSMQHAPVRVVGRSKVATAQRAFRGEIVARDTATGDILLATDHPRHWWAERGRDGSRSFSCVDCADSGDAEPWLFYAGGDVQRPHFRHYARLADGSEPTHGPESAWHLEAKRVLMDWARAEVVALSARQEVSVQAGTHGRRADVLVEGEGWRTALEAQHSYLGAINWAERHKDYEAAGIHDVWLFAPANEPHLSAELEMSSQSCFVLDLVAEEIGMLVVGGVNPPWEWWRSDGDLLQFVDHLAKPGERWTEVAYVALNDCHLDPTGRLVMPSTRLKLGDITELEAERSRLRESKARRDASVREIRERWRAQQAAPVRATTSSRLTCVVCGYPMDPDVYRNADRHMPEMRCADWR